jgi:hypothetical protein
LPVIGFGGVMTISWIQWPAMVVTIAASYWVASDNQRWRCVGSWLFPDQQRAVDMWAIAEDAYVPIILPVGLALMKIRGVDKNAWNVRTTSR